jgi:regulator of extracellular matrix RemA (YlzA/DUF370 family)
MRLTPKAAPEIEDKKKKNIHIIIHASYTRRMRHDQKKKTEHEEKHETPLIHATYARRLRHDQKRKNQPPRE